MKRVKQVLLFLLIGIGISIAIYHELVIYGIRQGYGQLQIIWNSKPIEDYLNDSEFPDSLKLKIRLIDRVRQYAIDSLGLKDSRNYKTLYDQKGKEIMWVVTACEPFQLIAKEWNFPVVGTVPYKGFFEEQLALEEKDKLELEGWDVSIRNPGGWSTLGWFTDPILSDMLNRNEGELASLIIHEMVHSTIFVKDSVQFNENLASFIGDRGAERFLSVTYGPSSLELNTFITEDRDYMRYSDHILRGCDYLDSVYNSIRGLPVEDKVRYKESAIRKIIQSADTLKLSKPLSISKPGNGLPNNAYFMSFRRYQSRQDELWKEWQEVYKEDLRAYLKALQVKYPYL
ncbi:MAG: aminopeptidase [Cyclobacteriaceae bacterium]|nr:aminopeptidase [Cyclobacteriaceae bacterium]